MNQTIITILHPNGMPFGGLEVDLELRTANHQSINPKVTDDYGEVIFFTDGPTKAGIYINGVHNYNLMIPGDYIYVCVEGKFKLETIYWKNSSSQMDLCGCSGSPQLIRTLEHVKNRFISYMKDRDFGDYIDNPEYYMNANTLSASRIKAAREKLIAENKHKETRRLERQESNQQLGNSFKIIASVFGFFVLIALFGLLN